MKHINYERGSDQQESSFLITLLKFGFKFKRFRVEQLQSLEIK